MTTSAELKITTQLLDSTNKKLALEEQAHRRLKDVYERKERELVESNK